MNGSPITDCGGTFYDSGGITADYGNNENFSSTICSDGTSGSHISLLFNEIDLVPGDLLCFYDGTDDSAPQIACILDYSLTGPFIVRASSANLTGCITVTFETNGSSTGTGWTAGISCGTACQDVQVVLDNTTPPMIPAENGWIDICPGESVSFESHAEYPQNGQTYTQSDNTSTFTWDFGDGNTATGRNVSHTFMESGGYIVQLSVKDVNGCSSTNFISQRVRVAAEPTLVFTGSLPTQVCEGTEFSINSDLNSASADINVTPLTQEFNITRSNSEELFIPDGLDEYSTSINFNEFEPGAILTDISDLESICLNIEHSWMYDLAISITCPSGNTVVLQDYLGSIGNQVFLGIPNYDTDSPCDDSTTDPGEGAQYCFSGNSVLGTFSAAAFSLMDGSILPPDTYSSFENLENLLGCPLNGVWTITVSDNLPCDDGWIFEWTINFDEGLYHKEEAFTPEIVNWNWKNNPNVGTLTSNTITSASTFAGETDYRFQYQDEFGCTYDTSFAVEILPQTHPDCFTCLDNMMTLPDSTICQGDMIELDVTYSGFMGAEVDFLKTPTSSIGFSNHSTNSPFESIISINSIFPNTITNPLNEIAAICVNFDTDATGDIQMRLIAPSGEELVLTNNLGGNGDDFTNTCFTPSAMANISMASPPFTGNFQPLTNWGNLIGANINGDWTLSITDDSGISNFGMLHDWSISFNASNQITYSWSNDDGLSCNNCPNPTAAPSMTTDYQVQTTDEYGCSLSDEARITVVENLIPPNLYITDMSGGTVFIAWDPLPGADDYEININNMGWIPTTSPTSHQASVFNQDDPVVIKLRAITIPVNCPHDQFEIRTAYDTCFLSVNPGFMGDVTCFGAADGFASINVFNGVEPFTYTINGSNPQDFGVFQNLDIGTYWLAIEDGDGCKDSIMVEINQPPPLEVTSSFTAVSCNGGDDGTIEGIGSGGIPFSDGTYKYFWTITGAGQDSLVTGVEAGTYELSVRDSNNCTVEVDITVTEPDAITLNSSANDATCNGGSDGNATVIPSGGTPNYTYLWDDMQTGSTAIGLNSGQYFVTVTDMNMCTAVSSTIVDEPDPGSVGTNVTPTLCNGSSDGTATVDVLGPTPHTYLWDDAMGQTTVTAIDLEAGDYMVTLTDGNGCISIGTANVTQPNPFMVNGVGTSASCYNSPDGSASVGVQGGTFPYFYSWNPSGQIGSTAINLLPGDYTVTITDINFCTTTEMVTVTAPPAITLQLDSTLASCSTNDDGTASVIAGGGAGGFSYQWDDPNMQTSATAVDLFEGTYQVTVTDGNDCTATEDIEVGSDIAVQIDTIFASMPACNGENTGMATVNPMGGTMPYSYLWDDSNGQPTATATSLAAGDYTVTVFDDNNCFDIQTVSITEPSLLIASIDSSMIDCFGASSGEAIIQPSGGTYPYTYSWNDPSSQTDSIASNLEAGTYSVTVSDMNNCTLIEDIIVTEPNSAITSLVTQTFVGCFETATNEAMVEANGGTGTNYTYLWSNDMNTPITNTLESGWQYVSITDENNCTIIDSIDIRTLEPIEVNTAFVQPSCFGFQDASIGVNVVSGGIGGGDPNNYNYQWSASAANEPIISNLGGDMQYTVIVSDAQGCEGEDTVFVTQPALIEVTTIHEDVSCFGFNDGEASIADAQGDHNVYTYQWDASANNATTMTVSDLSTGTYLVTVTDSTACSVTTSIFIGEPSPVDLSIVAQDNACNGEDSGTAAANVLGGTSPYSYFWSNSELSREIIELASGMYYITVLDANGCESMDSVFIESPSEIDVALTIDEPDCFGDSDGLIQFNATGGTAPFNYSIDGENFSSVPMLSGLTGGEYSLMVTDNEGCEWDSLVMISMPEEFMAELGENLTIQSGDSIQLNLESITGNTGAISYSWSSTQDSTLNCLNCPNPFVDPLNTTIYEVVLIDENGCMTEDLITIFVEKNVEVLVPTGFTPNDDGRNDLLHVHGKSRNIQQINQFKVFDRWGECVYEENNFQVNDLTLGWDGSFKGKEMPPGVYVWFLEVELIDGTTDIYKGQTNLIR